MGKNKRVFSDAGFRKWLEEKNIEPGWLFALGTEGTIRSYRTEYLASKKRRRKK